MPVVVLLSLGGTSNQIATSDVSRFYAEERPNLMAKMMITGHNVTLHGHRIAKFGHANEVGIHRLASSAKGNIDSLTSKSNKGVMYYQEACRYWLKASHRTPRFYKEWSTYGTSTREENWISKSKGVCLRSSVAEFKPFLLVVFRILRLRTRKRCSGQVVSRPRKLGHN
jgi:hypothetical protein